MYHSLSDDEFCRIVHNILKQSIKRENDFQIKFENYFNNSFPMIRQRYKRVTKKTLNRAYEELRFEYAKERLKYNCCFEVMSNLGFKYESNFAKWFRKHAKMNPSEYHASYKKIQL